MNATPGPELVLTDPPDPDTKTPKLKLPPGSWDCLIHVYGPAEEYPFDPLCPYRSAPCLPETYIRQQEILGLSKAVITNGAGYGCDNRYLLQTLARFPDRFCGITYMKEDTRRAAVRELKRQGVRGARFAGGPAWAHLPRLTPKIARTLQDEGCHVEFLTFTAGGMAAEKELMLSLPNEKIVLDHFGKPDAHGSLDDPGFTSILELLDTGRFWVKLSNPRGEMTDKFPYPHFTPFARKLVAHAPERLLWASNWPHPMMNGREMANDGDLVDLIAEWIPDARIREQILVKNPEIVYGPLA